MTLGLEAATYRTLIGGDFRSWDDPEVAEIAVDFHLVERRWPMPPAPIYDLTPLLLMPPSRAGKSVARCTISIFMKLLSRLAGSSQMLQPVK
jgi:hypothetical protein